MSWGRRIDHVVAADLKHTRARATRWSRSDLVEDGPSFQQSLVFNDAKDERTLARSTHQ